MRVVLLILTLGFSAACVSSNRLTFHDLPGDRDGLISATELALADTDRYILYIDMYDSFDRDRPHWRGISPSNRVLVDDKICVSFGSHLPLGNCSEIFVSSKLYSRINGEDIFEELSEESLARAKKASSIEGAYFAVEAKNATLGITRTLQNLDSIGGKNFCGVIRENRVPKTTCLSYSEIDHFRLADRRSPRNVISDTAEATLQVSATASLIALFGAAAIIGEIEGK